MSIRLITLGPPRCFIDDKPADLPAQKLRFALLLYLAVQKRTSRESVSAMFWPERDEEKARHTLSQNIYELRKVLGDDWLAPQADPLEITEWIRIDAVEFEQHVKAGEYEKAIELYHGDFLAGFHIKGSNEFESWIETKRRELKRLHHRAYRDHIIALLAAGKITPALTQAQRWVSLDPLDDEANHTLIDVLAHNGKRAEAIAHYDRFEKQLKAELDVAPLDETKKLIARIRETNGLASNAPDVAPSPLSPGLYRDLSTSAVNETTWEKIKRSRIAKTAAVYTASTFVVVQFADVMVPSLKLPPIIINIVAVLAVLGFPVAVGMAWALDSAEQPRGGLSQSDAAALTRERLRLRKLSLRAVGATAFSVAVSAILLYAALSRGTRTANAANNDSAVVLFPVAGVPSAASIEQSIYEAFSKWRDLQLTSPRDARALLNGGTGTTNERARITRSVGAGYFVSVITRVAQDSTRVFAAIYDVDAPGTAIRRSELAFDNRSQPSDSVYAALAAVLLFGDARVAAFRGGTSSIAAGRAYEVGLVALRAWDLAAADSLFDSALRRDQEFTRAYYWLALTRYWQKREPATWSYLLVKTAKDTLKLGEPERLTVAGLRAVAAADLPAACNAFHAATERDPQEFSGWLNYATCLFADNAVVRDSRSASGFVFRSGHHTAVQAYRRALELMPSVHQGMGLNSYRIVRQTLYTARNKIRAGRPVAPDTGTFSAQPLWRNDSLSFVPVPDAQLLGNLPWQPREVDEAVRQQRRTFYQIARTWVSAAPRSPDAVEAAALGLEMLGYPSAPDTLRRARLLASTTEQKIRLGSLEVLMRVRRSIPDGTDELITAKTLADSVLEAASAVESQNLSSRVLNLLGSVAALRGFATRAAMASAQAEMATASEASDGLLIFTAQRLLTYSAMGGPRDSIRVLEAEVRRAITSSLPGEQAEAAMSQWIVRAAVLAIPVQRSSAFEVWTDALPVYSAQRAWLSGQQPHARTLLREREVVRKRVQPWDRTLDMLFAESWLWSQIDSPRTAIAWMDPTLTNLDLSAPEALASTTSAASLMRLLTLRAHLAALAGDTAGAARWARSVVIFWRGADPFLKPEVERLNKYVLAASR